MGNPRELDTYIYRMGTAPNTRVAVSQKNKVYGYMVGKKAFQQIGVVSEFGFDESRTIDPVRGVGFGDQIAELVPSVTEPMSVTLNRTLMYTVGIFQVLGYRGGVEGLVRSLRHHRWPFDLKQELVFPEIVSKEDITLGSDAPSLRGATTQPGNVKNLAATSIKALFTFYEGCWVESFNSSFTSDAAIIAENTTIKVTDIIDGVSTYGEYIDSGLSPISANGTSGAGYSLRFAGNSNVASTSAFGA